VKTSVIFFPFDLFGSPGAGSGAELLADEFAEILADNRRETVATRARAYTDRVRVKQFTFANLSDYATWREQGREAVRQVAARGDRLLWVAGNHLAALPVYDELADRDDVLVVQLDAHLDIHHFADCSREPTHGNFLLHCAGRLPPIVNVGHRELLLTPSYIARHYRRAISAGELAGDPAGVLATVREAAASCARLYVDLDCDVFDPSYVPGVARPAPFGLSPAQVLAVLDAAGIDRAAGLILSEFDPSRDRDDRSLAALVWLIEHVLIRWHEGPKGPKGA
jgi:agmatinase